MEEELPEEVPRALDFVYKFNSDKKYRGKWRTILLTSAGADLKGSGINSV